MRYVLGFLALLLLAYTGLSGQLPVVGPDNGASVAPAGRFSLAAHEAPPGSRVGGHTIERHVGRTEAQLRARLADEPGISAASSFKDLAQAERFVAAALAANRAAIDAWAKSAGAGERQAFDYSADQVVGHGILRSTGRLTEMRRVRLVLKLESFNGQRFYILTAYPDR